MRIAEFAARATVSAVAIVPIVMVVHWATNVMSTLPF